MTDGSSQGLFVIVAVVIFGIFVVISYLLFRDKLQTGLASIFGDSIYSVESDLNPNLVRDFGATGTWVASDSGKITRYTKLQSPNYEQLPSGIPDTVVKYEKNDKNLGGTLAYLTDNKTLGLVIGDTVEVSALIYLPEKYTDSYISIGSWDVNTNADASWINAQLKTTANYESGKWFRYYGTVKITSDLNKRFVVGVTLRNSPSQKTEIYVADYQIKKTN